MTGSSELLPEPQSVFSTSVIKVALTDEENSERVFGSGHGRSA
jgi:hypothetical protein